MKKKIITTTLHTIVGTLVTSKVVMAGSGTEPIPGFDSNSGTGYTTLQNPITSNNFTELILAVTNFLLFLAVPFLVIAIIWVGFQFVMAQGNPTKLSNAKSNLVWTLVGAAIIVGVKLITAVLEGTINSIIK